MSDIHGPKETKAVVHFCPQCGSASVSGSTKEVIVPEGMVRCAACGWAGTRGMLASLEFGHEFASEEDIAKTLMRDLRGLIASDAGSVFAKFLLKWGFLVQPADSKLLARYLAAIARETLGAIIKERAKIDKERVEHGRTRN